MGSSWAGKRHHHVCGHSKPGRGHDLEAGDERARAVEKKWIKRGSPVALPKSGRPNLFPSGTARKTPDLDEGLRLRLLPGTPVGQVFADNAKLGRIDSASESSSPTPSPETEDFLGRIRALNFGQVASRPSPIDS